jgi:4-diphosphocytidyl-2-C-methyl-D-erythritol kinase
VTRIVEPAPAKINLALHVRHRRADGYHELETLFAFATDGDIVTVEPAPANVFDIDGPQAHHLTPSPLQGRGPGRGGVIDDNLVTRAAKAFRQTFDVTQNYHIRLTKNLPVASGIGGGSADAAATLRALARLNAVPLDHPSLHAIAATLGADVPPCLTGRTALGTGRGDDLVALEGLAGTPLLLVNPRVAVSTAAVFAGWDGIDRGALPEGDLLTRARAGRNDLEAPATCLAPVIADVRASLDAAPGAILSRMSGSGATCFALFTDPAARDTAAEQAARQGWWSLATTMA